METINPQGDAKLSDSVREALDHFDAAVANQEEASAEAQRLEPMPKDYLARAAATVQIS